MHHRPLSPKRLSADPMGYALVLQQQMITGGSGGSAQVV
jgi:hypothetical protein